MITFNQLSEHAFFSKNGYIIFILGKQSNVDNVYFCSAKFNGKYIGFFPIEKTFLLAELNNCESNCVKGTIDQEALLWSLDFYYKTCAANKNAISLYFTCSIDKIFVNLDKAGLPDTPLMVPSNENINIQ